MEGNGLQADVTEIEIANATLDNSQNASDHTYTYTAQVAQQVYTNWSRFPGVDSILDSIVEAGAPALDVSDDGRDLLG